MSSKYGQIENSKIQKRYDSIKNNPKEVEKLLKKIIQNDLYRENRNHVRNQILNNNI